MLLYVCFHSDACFHTSVLPSVYVHVLMCAVSMCEMPLEAKLKNVPEMFPFVYNINGNRDLKPTFYLYA